MLINKMYKLEKIVHSYNNDEVAKTLQQKSFKPIIMGNKMYVECGNLGNPYYISNFNEAAYLEAALSIPYDKMLEQVNYYYNSMMDEADELFWIERLGEEYNLDCHLVVLRFKAVEKLSKNLIYRKKMKELYEDNKNIESNKNKKLIKKP